MGHVFNYRAAEISADKLYRYSLDRGWPGGTGVLVFILLNPSTGDWNTDDKTIRRLVRFAQKWGYNSFILLNLFAWRSTDPEGLLVAISHGRDPVGSCNDEKIREVLTKSAGGSVVVGWGSHSGLKSILPGRARAVLAMLKEMGIRALCFGQNADGSPKHPLYLAKSTKLVDFQPPPEMVA